MCHKYKRSGWSPCTHIGALAVPCPLKWMGNWQTFLEPNYPQCHCEIRFLTQPLMHASISTYPPIDFHAWCLAIAVWAEAPYEKGVSGILIHLWNETRHEYAKVELSQQSEWYPPHCCQMSWVGDNWLPFWGIGDRAYAACQCHFNK